VDSVNIFKNRLDKYWFNQDCSRIHICTCQNWRWSEYIGRHWSQL